MFPGILAPSYMEVTSDANGALGIRAYFNTEWFSGVWVHSQMHQSITYKELLPVMSTTCSFPVR